MNYQTDNSLMAYINRYDSGKKAPEDLPSLNISDIAMTWKQQSSVNKDAIIAESVSKYRKLGFKNDEIEEVLMADGHDQEDIARHLHSEPSGRKIVSQKYDDVKYNLQQLAMELPIEEFMDIVTASSNPRAGMVRIASSDMRSFAGLISDLKRYGPSSPMAKEFDAIMKPFVDEELSRSKLSAVAKYKMSRFASTDHKNIFAINDGESTSYVDMNHGNCTCDRYHMGRFAELGLPCEHVLIVNKKFSAAGAVERAEEQVREKYGV